MQWGGGNSKEKFKPAIHRKDGWGTIIFDGKPVKIWTRQTNSCWPKEKRRYRGEGLVGRRREFQGGVKDHGKGKGNTGRKGGKKEAREGCIKRGMKELWKKNFGKKNGQTANVFQPSRESRGGEKQGGAKCWRNCAAKDKTRPETVGDCFKKIHRSLGKVAARELPELRKNQKREKKAGHDQGKPLATGEGIRPPDIKSLTALKLTWTIIRKT